MLEEENSAADDGLESADYMQEEKSKDTEEPKTSQIDAEILEARQQPSTKPKKPARPQNAVKALPLDRQELAFEEVQN